MQSTLTLISLLVCAITLSAAANRPNILFIAVDDLKPAISSYGVDAPTPNIDRLAAQGTSFLNAHCQQAICGPSRVSVMTGLYPDATGIWVHGPQLRERNPGIQTLPQHLSAHGYTTIGVGKIFDNRNVDSGRDSPSWSRPFQKQLTYAPGFDKPICYYQGPEILALAAQARAEGKSGWRAYSQYLQERNTWPSTEMLDVPDSAYNDGAMTDFAVQTLAELAELADNDGETPFFLAVGLEKPHLPFTAPKRYWDLIQPEQIHLAEFQRPAAGAPAVAYHKSGELRSYSDIPNAGDIPEALQRRLIHGYLASVAYIDAQIGRMIDALEASSLAENTIIVLWGDHGYHLGDHGLWNKHSNYEQATRVPLIIQIPNGKNQRITQPAELLDIFPTLCALTDTPIPEGLHGNNLAPTLESGAPVERRFAMSQFPREADESMGYALRGERYRYVVWFHTGGPEAIPATTDSPVIATELYDYQSDPLERRNLAHLPEHQERIDTMHQALLARLGK